MGCLYAASGRSEAERLIKQTYSVHVSLPEDRVRGLTRKWHLSMSNFSPQLVSTDTVAAAYFSQTTLDSLGTIDNIADVGDVPVPEGMFKSARASKINKRNDPIPVEDIGAATHEPWGVSMQPPAVMPFGVEPPKWRSGSPPPSRSPIRTTAPYGPAHNPYPTPRNSYESADYSARPLSSHHVPAAHYPPPPVPAGQLPSIHDTGLTVYRDPSPYTHSSSSSSDPGTSPRAFSSPLTPPSNVSLPLSASIKMEASAPAAAPKLVPLSYLQGLQARRRDPMDEHYLKRFSTPDASKDPIAGHRLSWNSGAPPYDRFGDDEAKPTFLQHGGVRW